MKVLEKYKGLLYLAGLVIVVPWLAYRMSIVDHVRMRRQAKGFEKELSALIAKSDPSLQQQASAVLHGEILQSGSLIPGIMDLEAGTRCKVVKYTPYITESRDGLEVHTAELVVSGTYTDLVRLVAKAEDGAAGCRLVSAAFRSIRQRQKKETRLHLTIVLQQVTNVRQY